MDAHGGHVLTIYVTIVVTTSTWLFRSKLGQVDGDGIGGVSFSDCLLSAAAEEEQQMKMNLYGNCSI